MIQAAYLSVLRSATPKPAMLMGFASELPAGLGGCIGIDVPVVHFDRSAGRPTYNWADSGSPDAQLLGEADARFEELNTRRLLEAVMERSDPLEPLDRAAAALREAWSNRAVRAWAGGAGLAISIDFSPISERAGSLNSLPERLRKLLAVPTATQPIVPDRDLDWPGKLMSFQLEGVQALLANRGLLLADDMGLGKTLQVIAAIRILRAKSALGACLVVAPASLLEQWRREIAKWAPEIRAIVVRGSAADRAWQWAADAELTLVSYDTLRADFDRNRSSPAWRRTWGVVVADEAQRIKNRNLTSGAVKRLRRQRSWALTGTPVENREDELASIIEFVDHDGIGVAQRYRPGAELRTRHQQLQLRRKKTDVLSQLPPKRIATVPIELPREQASSYALAEQQGTVYLESLGRAVRLHHLLELIARLKQICNADPQTGRSGKLDDLQRRLEQLTLQGHKALVFSQYVGERFGVAAIAKRLRRFNPLAITGAMPVEERSTVIDHFKTESEHKVLVLSLGVGGLGLNLQEASYVFHMDRWWNPAVERQSEDRSHRIGQFHKVNVIKYSCVGTIEERIDEILKGKQNLFDELVDDVSLDLSGRLSRGDLLGLFGLAEGTVPEVGPGGR